MPATRTISIGDQQRDLRQHGIRLEFDRRGEYADAAWILLPFVVVAALVLIRRPNSDLCTYRQTHSNRSQMLVSRRFRTIGR
jgi:hypothetical protein